MTKEEFYSQDVNLDNAIKSMQYLVKHNNLKEIMWIFRNLSHEQVCYWGEDHKGIIYQDDSYSQVNREQACKIQRMLSTASDLFSQSILQHREFEESYLEKWTDGGYLQIEVANLKNHIKELEETIDDIRGRCN